MVKGYVYESKLHKQYPDIKIIYSSNMDKALSMVSQGHDAHARLSAIQD